jgi:hypothetical protein
VGPGGVNAFASTLFETGYFVLRMELLCARQNSGMPHRFCLLLLDLALANLQSVLHFLWFRIRSRLQQRHRYQSTTLTSLFYKNIYIYSYESNFQDKSIYMIFHIFKLNDLFMIYILNT